VSTPMSNNVTASSINTIVTTLHVQQEAVNDLIERLISHAYVQEYTERQYDQLAVLTKKGMQIVGQVTLGTTVSEMWVQERDQWLQAVQRFTEDAPPEAPMSLPEHEEPLQKG
jgi:hypothetical protein